MGGEVEVGSGKNRIPEGGEERRRLLQKALEIRKILCLEGAWGHADEWLSELWMPIRIPFSRRLKEERK